MGKGNKMSTALALTGKDLEAFVVRGDLSVLPPEAKATHYLSMCDRVGLDPTSKPFEYLKLNGKEVLYATKGAAEQLRKIHKVAVTITSRESINDCYIVTALATLPDGRTDESVGAVSIGGLKGDALCNAIMKAETKAKRRVTLSALGLGMLDESELDTIPADRFANMPAPKVVAVLPATKPTSTLQGPPPDTIEVLPDDAVKAFGLEQFQGRQLKSLETADLEEIQEAVIAKLQKAKTENGRAWLNKIGSTCVALLNERGAQ
jgi:hypothetical protein